MHPPRSPTRMTLHKTSLISALLKSLSAHFSEHLPCLKRVKHIPSCSYDSSSIALLLVSNQILRPPTFGWPMERHIHLRPCHLLLSQAPIKVNVHYYEDGNVCLTTTKKISIDNAGSTGGEVVRKIGSGPRRHTRKNFNRAFVV